MSRLEKWKEVGLMTWKCEACGLDTTLFDSIGGLQCTDHHYGEKIEGDSSCLICGIPTKDYCWKHDHIHPSSRLQPVEKISVDAISLIPRARQGDIPLELDPEQTFKKSDVDEKAPLNKYTIDAVKSKYLIARVRVP